jgi:hypothetical protein
VYWLWNKAQEYEPMTNMGAGVWLAVAIFGIAGWIGLARFFAEGPGRTHGNMFVWWGIISLIHVWALPVYLVYAFISNTVRARWQDEKERKYADRTRAEIFASAKGRPPPIKFKQKKK